MEATKLTPAQAMKQAKILLELFKNDLPIDFDKTRHKMKDKMGITNRDQQKIIYDYAVSFIKL